MRRRYAVLPGQLELEWRVARTDQQRVIILAQRGDRAAMASLCRDHDRYAIKLTNRWSRSARDWEDALQQARLGIVEAILTYDVERGGRLLTHVHWQIMRRLKDETRRRDRMKPEVHLSSVAGMVL
jgi:DNA-directed RNA polymerase specialized sigma subunit